VRAVWGIALTLPLAAGHRPRRPIAGDLARSIARIRALECEAAEALGAPRAHPSIDRRADEDAGADQRVVGKDGFEQALALEEGRFEEPLPVEPEEVDGDEIDRVVLVDGLRAEFRAKVVGE